MGVIKRGSRWLKFDFHTHTPASSDFGLGDADACGIAPSDWLRKAMESQIDCVVVTDHNTGKWVDILKIENEHLRSCVPQTDWYRDLTIFPGVEITIDANQSRIHILGVFDPSVDTETISAIVGECGVGAHFGDCQMGSTTSSFKDVADVIRKNKGIPIAAHIDGSKGLLYGASTLNTSIDASLKAVDAAQFCNLAVLETYDKELQVKLERVARIAGSDAHTVDELGRHYSWVKMGTPSIDALKLALMDYRYSVLNQVENPNKYPDNFLSKLTITNMVVCGRGAGNQFEIDLHPHFNAFIGGRGSGKSTVLESVRIVSRQDQNLREVVPRTAEAIGKFMNLASGNERGVMLERTHIALEFFRRSILYRLHWKYDGKGPILEEMVQGLWQEVEEFGNIAERFSVQVYSQKQINELAANTNGLLEFIDRSRAVNKTNWQSRYDRIKNEYLELKARLRSLKTQLDEGRPLKANLQDLENDLKSYEEGGHKDILLLYRKRRQQWNALPSDEVFNQFTKSIAASIEDIALSDLPDNLFSDDDPLDREVLNIHIATASKVDGVVQTLLRAQQEVESIKKEWQKSIIQSAWFSAFRESEEAYIQLAKAYETKHSELSLRQYNEWVERKDVFLARLKDLEGIQREVLSVTRKVEQNLETLKALHEELFDLRTSFINEVIQDNQYVRMQLVKCGDTSKIEERYRSILGLEPHLFVSSVYDSTNEQGILAPFIHWEDLGVSENDLPTVIEEIKAQTRAIAMGQRSQYHGTFDNRLQELYRNNPSAFDELDAWWPEDLLRVKYPIEQNRSKFEALEKGSDGQRAAAILAFLLSYGDTPLIIDQPEDDLDNALIYDLIVKQIHENKLRRQLLIATHNPNIVVNGDADLVHVMKFINGQITVSSEGYLDNPEIRREVCTIMEGGREAFVKRYKRVILDNRKG